MTDPSPAGAADDDFGHTDATGAHMVAASGGNQQHGVEVAAPRAEATSVSTQEGSLVAIWRGLEVILRSILQSIQRIEQAESRRDGLADVAGLRQSVDQALERSANRQRVNSDQIEDRILHLLARLDSDGQDTRRQFGRIERAAKAIEGRLGMLATSVDRLERETGAVILNAGVDEGSSLPALVRRVDDIERRLSIGSPDQPSAQADLKTMLADVMDLRDHLPALSAAE